MAVEAVVSFIIFIAASTVKFINRFVGRCAARAFVEARKVAHCVVFIDGLDAVGGKRGLGLNEERDQTLNQLLTELDGFEGRTGVLLLAVTNRQFTCAQRPDHLPTSTILATVSVEEVGAFLYSSMPSSSQRVRH